MMYDEGETDSDSVSPGSNPGSPAKLSTALSYRTDRKFRNRRNTRGTQKSAQWIDAAWEAIMELIARASLNETEDRDTYADGYCNGLRSSLGVVHEAAQKAWEDSHRSPALDEPGKEEVDDGSR